MTMMAASDARGLYLDHNGRHIRSVYRHMSHVDTENVHTHWCPPHSGFLLVPVGKCNQNLCYFPHKWHCCSILRHHTDLLFGFHTAFPETLLCIIFSCVTHFGHLEHTWWFLAKKICDEFLVTACVMISYTTYYMISFYMWCFLTPIYVIIFLYVMITNVTIFLQHVMISYIICNFSYSNVMIFL